MLLSSCTAFPYRMEGKICLACVSVINLLWYTRVLGIVMPLYCDMLILLLLLLLLLY